MKQNNNLSVSWAFNTVFVEEKKKNSAVGKTDLNSNNKIYMKVLKCSDYP